MEWCHIGDCMGAAARPRIALCGASLKRWFCDGVPVQSQRPTCAIGTGRLGTATPPPPPIALSAPEHAGVRRPVPAVLCVVERRSVGCAMSESGTAMPPPPPPALSAPEHAVLVVEEDAQVLASPVDTGDTDDFSLLGQGADAPGMRLGPLPIAIENDQDSQIMPPSIGNAPGPAAKRSRRGSSATFTGDGPHTG